MAAIPNSSKGPKFLNLSKGKWLDIYRWGTKLDLSIYSNGKGQSSYLVASANGSLFSQVFKWCLNTLRGQILNNVNWIQPWWLGSLERVSNSSRHSLAIGGSNPAWGRL